MLRRTVAPLERIRGSDRKHSPYQPAPTRFRNGTIGMSRMSTQMSGRYRGLCKPNTTARDRYGIAYCLALPIGWERERGDRSAGIRTFPLVAIASCAFVLGTEDLLRDDAEGRARIIEG